MQLPDRDYLWQFLNLSLQQTRIIEHFGCISVILLGLIGLYGFIDDHFSEVLVRHRMANNLNCKMQKFDLR